MLSSRHVTQQIQDTKKSELTKTPNALVIFFFPAYSYFFYIMLAASRKVIISTASKATYATAATSRITTASNGVKVASNEEPGQTASLAVIVGGGSRAESNHNAGVAHFLKNYGFKVTL
jgi:hypothetical protein